VLHPWEAELSRCQSDLGNTRHDSRYVLSRISSCRSVILKIAYKGVNRWNLKIINLSTHYKPGLALELNPSPKEREKQINQKNKTNEHGDLFYRGLVLKNLVLVEVVTKTRSLSTLSLSQTVT
jgi:hypothetical protein